MMDDNEPHTHVPDPFDQYLASIPVAPASAELKAQILAKTLRVIRQHRWSRRFAVAAAMAACYAAGALTVWPAAMHAEVSTSSPSMASPGEVCQPLPSRSTGNEAAVVSSLPRSGRDTQLSPAQLEWQAIDQRHAGADLYRQAGDRYLSEAQDIESALRCYHNALARGGSKALAISPDDSWLLVALKSSHFQDETNVKTHD
jgi:hypothetical protein